jgi:hypothetical protein
MGMVKGYDVMLDNLNRLDLSSKDIELIEHALQTQKKILSVQSQAGGTGAQQKLAEVQRVIKRVGRARPAAVVTTRISWAQMAMNFLCGENRCAQGR